MLIRKINNFSSRGQTALILILLAAAALIFLAIILNWGRISQVKSMLTIGADQGASLLATDAASYGEMQKQQYLKDENRLTSLGGAIISFFALVIAVICLFIPIPGLTLLGAWLIVIAVAMAAVNLVLQLVVVQPMITSLWNNLQKNQPIQQQFFEQGLSTALQSTVTDQVNITDYFDANANGLFGNNAQGAPNDTISRFALFYSDRLKMLNQPDNPAVVNFYNQLRAFVGGSETCAQNASNHSIYGTPLNATCPTDCLTVPSDPGCQASVSNGSQLNDVCADGNYYQADGKTPNPAYNPYCDPCCLPVSVPDPQYCDPNAVPACTPNPMHLSPTIAVRPTSCPTLGVDANGNPAPDTSANGAPSQCWTNNPYNSKPPSNDSLYTLLYDPTYQEYANNKSFLDLWGRDLQELPIPTIASGGVNYPYIIPQGSFPNGIYPFFWLAKDYSLEVDNIASGALQPPQYHWCTIPTAPDLTLLESNLNGNPPFTYPPPGFPDLAQLSLPYACSGPDCCVNYIGGTIVGGAIVGGPAGVPAPTSTTSAQIDKVGSSAVSTAGTANQNLALNAAFGEGGTWLEGDNQLCTNPPGTPPVSPLWGWEYNASTTTIPDGTCQWTGNATAPADPGTGAPPPVGPNSTVDNLDETAHTMSDFLNFSSDFLGKDIGTLNSTFSSWYPQAADWIDPASSGRLVSAANNLNAWGAPAPTGVVANWLGQLYVDPNAWCVPSLTPPSPFYLQNATANQYCPGPIGTSCPIQEKTAIGPDANWGNLTDVTNCLDYNSNQSAVNYKQCNDALTTDKGATTLGADGSYIGCLSDLTVSGGPCDPVKLGRSLTGAVAPGFTVGNPGAAPACYSDCAPPIPSGVDNLSCSASYTPGVPVITPGQGETTSLTYTDTNSYQVPYCCGPSSVTCPSGSPGATCSGIPRTCTCPADPCDDMCDGSVQSCNAATQPTTSVTKSYSCDATKAGSFANWVQNSLTLATDEQPKFALRSAYLKDVGSRAVSMQLLFSNGGAALQSFLNGAAQQLINANQNPAAAVLPNAVIYGWVDKPLPDGQPGKAHIVKVTAYSPGRNGTGSTLAGFVSSTIPWIKTTSGWFTRTFELINRTGYVYVSIKRWDEDHANTVTFPNGHPLWQFLFHNPNSTVNTAGSGLPQSCKALLLPNSAPQQFLGFGLQATTVAALASPLVNISQADQQALSNAFMLNDEGSGQTDAYASPQNSQAAYQACLSAANTLLDTAPESHACAEYVPSIDATHDVDGDANANDRDYSLKFVDCSTIKGYSQPNDLVYEKH